MALKEIKGHFKLNNMSQEELQEWTTKIMCEAQRENSMNQNLELTRLYSSDVRSRVVPFERNAIDAAIDYYGLFMDNGKHQETSNIDDEQQPPPVRRQRLQSTLSNNFLIEPRQSQEKQQSHNNRNQYLYINEAVILQTIDSLGLKF